MKTKEKGRCKRPLDTIVILPDNTDDYCSICKDRDIYIDENHPIVKMWQGYEQALLRYGMAICEEWKTKGYKDTMLDKFVNSYNIEKDIGYPSWFGKKSFHASHRSNLLRKNKEYYSKFDWKEPDNLPYVWNKIKENSNG